MSRPCLRATFVCLALLLSAAAAAQPLEPIRYTVSFPAPQTHYVEVAASIPTDGEAQVDLMMPVWTPGSYLVREYARNVEALTARDSGGASLAVEKTRKNRWRVTAGTARTISLQYRVYAHEMSVRTNWVDDQFALLNGAPTFITRLSARDRPYEIRLQLPRGWSQSLSGMTSPEPDVYRAPDYDTLVDSPIVAGNPVVREFSAGGKPHYLVNIGEGTVWDGDRAVSDLADVVRKTIELWGSVPYDRYYFFNVIGWPNNGLEHKNSTMLNTGRLSTRTRVGYLDWLGLAAHEHFHAWNVKRLRPIELGPFDYENEVYTRALWFSEGVTDYYADLLVHHAGVSSRDEYLQQLSALISNLQTTPGRLVQPVETASYDAWIKYYRPDENSANSSISYYVKGAVVGFLLDAKIRRASGGTKTLDDFMRLMYRRYSGARGFTSADLRNTASELAGSNGEALKPWLARALETTDELDYGDALDWFGLAFRAPLGNRGAYLGATVAADSSRTTIGQVRRGTPAFDAGLDAGDEVLAIDDARVPPGQLAARIAQFTPGDAVVLTISRNDVVRRIGVTLGEDPGQAWQLAAAPDASPAQRSRLDAWLDAP